MKTLILKHLYFSILICVFVLTILMSVLSAQTNSGIERLQDGIADYENGRYDEAIFNLEMSKIQLSEDDKENIWKTHIYLGLSYYLAGNEDEAKKGIQQSKWYNQKQVSTP